MPSYCYHLKFELYPVANPNAKGNSSEAEIWRPSPSSSIFDDLPAHPRRQRGTTSRRYNTKYTDKSFALRAEAPTANVIDCGSVRAAANNTTIETSNVVHLSEQQWQSYSHEISVPRFEAGIGPRTAARDWRFGAVSIESFDLIGAARAGDSMGADESQATPAASLGPILGGPGQATKARYIPLETKNTELGWGIVHLYRENDESYLKAGTSVNASAAHDTAPVEASGSGTAAEDDCTVLCIPAVPSYLSPSDFLGFVGENWRGDVTHYRMVMTSRMNRYMVLMKFRDSGRARDWRKEFDGKAFNSMEAEICHVTFIKSITVEMPNQPESSTSDSQSDRFGPVSAGVANSLKPFPPPTPSLIELPTCTVCLERMDDTTGLMTILCQHVFHCTCLQTWKGSGCPVCRATNPSPEASQKDPDGAYTQPFGSGNLSNLCSVCDEMSDLWICLICGNVGCGRYKGGHAKDHWKETAHSFSLELETQHVWDYAGDMWVHRLIRDKGDGKVVELPSNDHHQRRRRPRRGDESASEDEEEDVVPRAKLDRIGMEYTHLLTSQLESQRVYFEEMVSKAADKAAKAASAAEAATAQAQEALRELRELRKEHRELKNNVLPGLERDLARERARAEKATDLARGLGRQLQEEKRVGEGLMQRIGHVNGELESARAKVAELNAEGEELRETNRDLTMFISGQEKLRELENEGKVDAGEIEEGTVSLPEEKKRGKGKGKGRR